MFYTELPFFCFGTSLIKLNQFITNMHMLRSNFGSSCDQKLATKVAAAAAAAAGV